MSDTHSHHYIYGVLTDYLTGEELTDTDDERHRQDLARFMVDDRGYQRDELTPRLGIDTLFTRNFVRSVIDLTVTIHTRQTMIIRYAPGSLVSRERAALAAARLLNPDYQIPLTVVTNFRDAELLDTATGKILGYGLHSIPNRQELESLFPKLLFVSPPDENKKEKEMRILNAFDLEICCRF